MYGILMQAHSGWRYLVLLALVIVLAKYLIGWLGSQQWSDLDRRIGAYTTIVIDIQLLIGLILWGWGAGIGLLGAVPARTIEHPITMIIAIGVMHIGWSRTKKAQPANRFRIGALTFIGVTVLVVLGLTRVGGIF